LLNHIDGVTEFRSVSTDYQIKMTKLQEIIDDHFDNPEQFKSSLQNKGVALLMIYDFCQMPDVNRKWKLLNKFFTSTFAFRLYPLFFMFE
jgi:hypothetical protein